MNLDTLNTSKLSHERITELDGVRGLAILLVIGYHYLSVPIPAGAQGGYAILRKLFSYGWTGVDLFFVLSGFLIAGILIDHRDAENFFGVFYIRRVSRIFPLYYFFLSFFLLLKVVATYSGTPSPEQFNSPITLSSFALFLQNFSMVKIGGFGNELLAVTWSLAVEEQFYLFLPLLIRKSKPNRLLIHLVFCVSIPLMLRATVGSGLAGFVLMPWRLDSLMLGALLAIIYRARSIRLMIQNRLSILRIIFILQLVYFGFIFANGEVGALDHYFFFAVFYTTFILIILVDRELFWVRFFRMRFLRFIGAISFSLYLFHQMMNGILHNILLGTNPGFLGFNQIAVTGLAFVLSICAAFATFHLFEKRFIGWGHQFKYRLNQSGI